MRRGLILSVTLGAMLFSSGCCCSRWCRRCDTGFAAPAPPCNNGVGSPAFVPAAPPPGAVAVPPPGSVSGFGPTPDTVVPARPIYSNGTYR